MIIITGLHCFVTVRVIS